jgi:hypothetical protein
MTPLPPTAIRRTTHLDRAALAVAVLVLLPIASLALTAAFGRGAPAAFSSAAGLALRDTLALLAGVAAFTAGACSHSR